MLVNVLIVEDEPEIAESIRVGLEQKDLYAIIAGTLEAAREIIATILPDLILLKWILKGESSAAFARQLRAGVRTGAIPLILLGPTYDEKRRIDEMIRGADGCVEHSAPREEIIGCVGAALRASAASRAGQSPLLAGDPVTTGGLSVDPARRRVFLRRDDTQIELRVGRTERRLLYLLISNPERVFSRTQLLEQLWGDRDVQSVRIVDSYVKRLRASLRSVGCDRMIESVRGFGYRFTLEGTPRTVAGEHARSREKIKKGSEVDCGDRLLCNSPD
jgi:two-component system phosphate regulon response regulator PhoB